MLGTSSPAVTALGSHAGDSTKHEKQNEDKTFTIYKIKQNLYLGWSGLKKSPLSEAFRQFVDCNLRTKRLAIKKRIHDLMSENCFFLCVCSLSEQGAFVPKTEGRTKKKKKGIVFVVFFLFLCSIMSEKPHHHY